MYRGDMPAGGDNGRARGDWLAFRMRNDLAELGRLLDDVEAYCSARDVPHEVIRGLAVALDELITNTVTHGYPDGRDHDIELHLDVTDSGLSAEVIDDASAFNPLEHPVPDTTLPAEQRPIGGLGIHLVRNLMDEVAYERRDGRNHVRLVKRM